MRLLIDTSYLLPAIGISIRGISRTAVHDFASKGHTLTICTITLFELAAKGAKFAASGELEPRKVRDGLNAILHDPRIAEVPFEEPEVVSRALALRENMVDFVDCLIVAAAALTSDILVTEDEKIQRSVAEDRIRAKARPTIPAFYACSSKRLG